MNYKIALLLSLTFNFADSSELTESVVKKQKLDFQSNQNTINVPTLFDCSDYITSDTLDKNFLKAINGAIFYLKRIQKDTQDQNLSEIFDCCLLKIKTCKILELKEVLFLIKELQKNEDLNQDHKDLLSKISFCLKSIFREISYQISNAINQTFANYNFPVDLSDIILDYSNPGQFEEIVVVKNEAQIDQTIFYNNFKKILIRSGNLIVNWDLKSNTLINKTNIRTDSSNIKSLAISEDCVYIFCCYVVYTETKIILLNIALEELDIINVDESSNNLALRANKNGILELQTTGCVMQFEVKEIDNKIKLNYLNSLGKPFGKEISPDNSKRAGLKANPSGMHSGIKINYLKIPIEVNLNIRGFYNFAWSNDSNKLVCADKNYFPTNGIFIWDTRVIDKVIQLKLNNMVIFFDIKMFWSPDDKFLAIITNGKLYFVDTVTGQEIKKIETDCSASDMKWIDNHCFAVIYKNQIKIYAGRTLI